jgi:hypothetical protein
METLIEVGNLLIPDDIALSHLIKLILDLGREVVVHNRREIIHKEVVDHHPHIGRNELALLDAIELSLLAGGDLTLLESDDLIFTLLSLVFTLLNVVAVLNG